jgi:hypothetical protein
VDISFTCGPIQVYDFETGTWTTTTSGHVDDASATIVQASGRSIASASGDSFGGAVTCDGSAVYTREIDVVASTAPFKTGAAVAAASVSIGAVASESGGGNFASSGPVSVRIVK